METSKWYEIHITVLIKQQNDLDIFSNFCKLNNIKQIVIDLQKDGVFIQSDVMTSEKIFGNYSQVKVKTKEIVTQLQQIGLHVIREKIESEPSHELAPQTINQKMPQNSYFESHIAFLCKNDEEIKKLDMISKTTNARISRNPLKKTIDGNIFLLTLRDYHSPFLIFSEKLDYLLNSLKNQSMIPYKKIEVEFAVFDSNWQHDNHWVT